MSLRDPPDDAVLTFSHMLAGLHTRCLHTHTKPAQPQAVLPWGGLTLSHHRWDHTALCEQHIKDASLPSPICAVRRKQTKGFQVSIPWGMVSVPAGLGPALPAASGPLCWDRPGWK